MTSPAIPTSANPTESVPIDFAAYLIQRKASLAARFDGGAPNYAFSLDRTLQKQLSSMAPIRSLTQTVVSFVVPLQKQIQQMNSLAVSPQQLPQIYSLAEECARLLGIGIPQVFICADQDINACTIATDDVAPIILLSSGIVERLTLAELKFVIGHECGHIHNLHGNYNTAVELMTNRLIEVTLKGLASAGWTDLLSTVGKVIHSGVLMFLKRWSRCAEITCDRAGLICCADLLTAQSALAKLVVGNLDHLGEINIQAFMDQSLSTNSTPLRLMEFFNTHPLIPKRIEALQLFTECETFYSWQPSLSAPATVRSQHETDQRCEQIVTILNNKNRTY